MSPSGTIMSYILPMQEKPALRPSVAVGEALRGVARDILAEARAAIEDSTKSDADAVHDFRRAMKRWRALLRLVEPFLGEEARRLRDEARDLAHALTGARNAQSALDALADLEKHGLALSARSIAGLRQRIDGVREAAETTLNADMRLRLGSALDQAAIVVERWPLHTPTFDDVADQLTPFSRAAPREFSSESRTRCAGGSTPYGRSVVENDSYLSIAASSRVMNSPCAARILRRASAGENHCARSTSGNDALRPLFGGHSSSKEFDLSVAGSKSPSSAQAVTILRPR